MVWFNKILDNADGKQARKTKNSTALGLLFDHGADCINTGLSGMAFFHIVNVGGGWAYGTFVMLYQIFFLITLEEYYVGSLDFGLITAVNEGTTSTFILLLVGVFAGNEIYHQEVFSGILLFEIAFSCILIGVVFQMIYILYKLFRYQKTGDVFQKLFLFACLNISYLTIVLLSKNDVIVNHPKILMYIYTILFSKIIISIMIAHIFHSNFNQIQVFPLFIMFVLISLVVIENFIVEGKFLTIRIK